MSTSPVPSYNPELDGQSFEQACVNLWAIWKAGYLSEFEYARMLVTINRRYMEAGQPTAGRQARFTPRESDPLFSMRDLQRSGIGSVGMMRNLVPDSPVFGPDSLPDPENPVTGQTTGGMNEMG